MPKRILQGTVVSDKNEKTVVVKVERRFTHPVMKKTVRSTKKYKAHDENNACKVGDTVAFTPRGAKTEYAKIVAETLKSKQAPSWLSLEIGALRGRVIGEPTLEQAEAFFDPNVIVEYYSR